mmetsp:Transcript_108323/g.306268  ORF Transcript_108323/g.306268 Transcript_108323/m.306268 type:complete len:239 (+) Transcript_108323:121-837(+)
MLSRTMPTSSACWGEALVAVGLELKAILHGPLGLHRCLNVLLELLEVKLVQKFPLRRDAVHMTDAIRVVEVLLDGLNGFLLDLSLALLGQVFATEVLLPFQLGLDVRISLVSYKEEGHFPTPQFLHQPQLRFRKASGGHEDHYIEVTHAHPLDVGGLRVVRCPNARKIPEDALSQDARQLVPADPPDAAVVEAHAPGGRAHAGDHLRDLAVEVRPKAAGEHPVADLDRVHILLRLGEK